LYYSPTSPLYLPDLFHYFLEHPYTLDISLRSPSILAIDPNTEQVTQDQDNIATLLHVSRDLPRNAKGNRVDDCRGAIAKPLYYPSAS
jgi:hypothetical protein